MNAVIQKTLTQIEQKENVRILLAVESGSRAWGFASPDSDYDVRFVYVRPKEHYLKLEQTRDVIELPIDDTLDVNGWDLRKMLQLLYKSNPTVFEWFSSPVVYRSSSYADLCRQVLPQYFFPKSSLRHYLSMAESNYREYLRADMVRAKKYFYALRPILACRHILQNDSPPPMEFSKLMQMQLPDALKPTVAHLLDLKQQFPEMKLIPRVDTINEYLDDSITEIRSKIEHLPSKEAKNWSTLNELFLRSWDQT